MAWKKFLVQKSVVGNLKREDGTCACIVEVEK